MKTNVLLIAAAFALSACAIGPWPADDSSVDVVDTDAPRTARLTGTVEDVRIDAPAYLYAQQDYGYLELTATTDVEDGLAGMSILYSDLTLRELVSGGSRVLDPARNEMLLCGETTEEIYDEPADEVEIVVDEEEDGEIGVLLRGSVHGGVRFQEVRFVLDAATLAPIDG